MTEKEHKAIFKLTIMLSNNFGKQVKTKEDRQELDKLLDNLQNLLREGSNDELR